MRYQTHIAACVGACFLIAALSSSAWAQKKVKVEIKSRPAGATVWIDDRTGEPAGTTPLTVRLPTGDHTIYIELDGYEALTRDIKVKRKRNRINPRLTELQTGSILVLPAEGSNDADEAKVFVDGKEVGTVPDSFDLVEGEHEIEIRKDGFDTFKQSIEVIKGETSEVLVKLAVAGTTPEPDGPDPDKEPDKPGPGEPEKPDPGAMPRISPFSIGASMGAAGRSYSYRRLDEAVLRLRPFDATSIGMVEVAAELRLGGLADVGSLRPFSIFGSFSINLPTESSSEGGNEKISTRWLRREVGLRSRFAFGSFWFAVDVAQSGDSLSFSGDNMEDIALLPELSYESLRLGALLGYDIGDNSFGVGGDGLLALSVGGIVEEEFDDDSAYGFRVHGWYRRYIAWNIEGMITARFLQFSHTFTNKDGRGRVADGARDRMFDVLGNVAYRF